MALPIAAAAVTAARTVGARAWTYAAQAAPSVIDGAKQMLEKSTGGKPIDSLLNSRNPATNQAIVKSLLDNGMNASSFIEGAQLTAQEAREYAQIVAAYQQKQAASVDVRQTPKETSGNTYIDTVTINNQIDEILDTLSISSDFYAKLIRGLNSHTSKDIETYQLDRQMRKQRRK